MRRLLHRLPQESQRGGDYFAQNESMISFSGTIH